MQKNTMSAYKNLSIKQNVSFRVIDEATGKVVQEHIGHNTATNSLLFGIAHHLVGDFLPNETHGLNPGYPTLSNYVPRYISLGTMGLINQNQDANGLPAGIGDTIVDSEDPEYIRLQEEMNAAKAAWDAAKEALAQDCQYWPACDACAECQECATRIGAKQQAIVDAEAAYKAAYQAFMTYNEETRFVEYMNRRPGYGADGYDANENNGRKYLGLGYAYTSYDNTEQYIKNDIVTYSGTLYKCLQTTGTPCGPFNPNIWEALPDPYQPSIGTTIQLELVSPSFPRQPIAYRDIVPEYQAELPKTIDVVFSAMISTGALKQFRPEGQDYIFITEAGLWSKKTWEDSGENGLLAGYRIAPPNEDNWDMTVPENREILKRNVLKVGRNQVVQVVWKVQIGSVDKFSTDAPVVEDYTPIHVHLNNSSSEPIPDVTLKITSDAAGEIIVRDAKTTRELVWTTTNVSKTANLLDGVYYLWELDPAPGYAPPGGPVIFEILDKSISVISDIGTASGTDLILVNKPLPSVVYFTHEGISALQTARNADTPQNRERFYPLEVGEGGKLYYHDIDRTHLQVSSNANIQPKYTKLTFNGDNQGVTPAQFKSSATMFPSDNPDYPMYYYQGFIYTDALGFGIVDSDTLRHLTGGIHPSVKYVSYRNFTIDPSIVNVTGLFADGGTQMKSIDVTGWDTSHIVCTDGAFAGLSNIEVLIGIDDWDMSSLQSAGAMFANLGSTSAASAYGRFCNLSSWQTPNLTYMSNMFSRSYIHVPPELDTHNVTNMTGALNQYGTLPYPLTTSPVVGGVIWLNWNTSKVTNMADLHSDGAWRQDSNSNSDYTGATYMIRNIDTSACTNFAGMFQGVKIPLAANDTSSPYSLSSKYAEYISSFDTSSAESFEGMFNGMQQVNNDSNSNMAYLDLTGWDTSNVTTMAAMFASMIPDTSNPTVGAPFRYINASGWDLTNVTTVARLFYEDGDWSKPQNTDVLQLASGITFGPVGHASTHLTTADHVCYGANALSGSYATSAGVQQTFLDLIGTSNIKTLNDAFAYSTDVLALQPFFRLYDLHSLEVGLRIFDGSITSAMMSAPVQITLPSSIDFSKCHITPHGTSTPMPAGEFTVSLNNITLSSDNQLHGIVSMLEQSPINKFIAQDWVINRTSLQEMFATSRTIHNVDLSRWDVTDVTNFQRMFANRYEGTHVLDYSSLDSWVGMNSNANYTNMCASMLSTESSVNLSGTTYGPFQQPYRFPDWTSVQGFERLVWDSDGLHTMTYEGQTVYTHGNNATPNQIPVGTNFGSLLEMQ